MSNILLLEDNISAGESLSIFLTKVGYNVYFAKNCNEAERLLLHKRADIIIADIMIPDGSGLELGKMVIENYKIPIIFLTAKDDENDILKGYEAGCEEYITKPISPRVLEKKIEAVLKRQKNTQIMNYKNLQIDFDKKRVWNKNEEIHLTSKEWNILEILAKNKGKVITKEVLLENIWDVNENYVDEHAITVVINRLRKKIEADMSNPIYVKNIFGVGYSFGE